MENKLKKLCQLIRYDILTSTTEAKSGHPTTSLSAVELMTTLFFGGFLKSDLRHPKGVQSFANDRVVFSKGHASPLIYALYHAAGAISYPELMRLRKINSDLEGHPTFRFKYADVATGSLGQGLSAGVGMALGLKLNFRANHDSPLRTTNYALQPKIFVLLGDSEMTEGQVWEAVQIASYYKLNNLIAIADINRLGQSTETMLGWDLETYKKRFEAFGWNVITVDDGHDLHKIYDAYVETQNFASLQKPTIILAKTIKGKGVSFLENKDGWHGKPLPKDMLESALKELGKVDHDVRGKILLPKTWNNKKGGHGGPPLQPKYELGSMIATRLVYGNALLALGDVNDKIVALDAEMSNSTYSEKFAKKFPERYFEMFIAEQNMITTALGMAKLGFIPFASTFAAFLTRGFDQLRMAQYSAPNLKIVGSHCGVSIGPDGPSQMGLEDISMFRSILNSTILYPSDAVSAFKLTEIMAKNDGLFYLRTNRKETPVIYDNKEKFVIGGSKIHYSKIRNSQSVIKKSNNFKSLIIAAGVTLHEALKAQKELTNKGVETVVLDVYSVKPLDVQSINQLTKEIKNVIVVEDHYPAGGIGEAVTDVIVNCKLKIENYSHLCVRKLPRSGSPDELLHYEEIDAQAIVNAVKKLA
ncbi:MAG: transketolase [Patescibacteria group bacterium]